MRAVETITKSGARMCREDGFTLIEAIIALVVLMVAILGVLAAVTYSTTYNTGNAKRSQALSVLQREVELIRSAKFLPAPAGADSVLNETNGQRDITGGVKADRIVTADGNNTRFIVRSTVDDDPFTPNIQIDPTKDLKEITVIVIPESSRPGSWEVQNRAMAIFRRTRAN